MRRIQSALVLSVLTLAGCGGGGGGGGNVETFPAYAATAADSMLLPVVTAAGDLQLFDPASPDSAAVTVDAGLDLPARFGSGPTAVPFANVQFIYDGVYQPATHAATAQHRRYAWYFKGGTPYRVDLLNSSSHEPVQFSSIADACGWNGMAIDYDNPLNTRVVVQVAGADTNCYTSDDTGQYVAIGAANSDPGVTVSPDLFFLEHVQATNGSLQRVLAFNFVTGDLLSYSPDLSSSTLLMATNPDGFGGGPDPGRTSQYFRLQPVGGGRGIYRYDAGTDSVTLVHAYATNGAAFAVADADYLYFSDGPSVFRVGHASTEPQPLHTFEDTVIFRDVEPTTNRLVFVLRNSMTGQDSLESLPKSGGSTRTVLDGEGLDLTLVATADAMVYYSRGSGGAGSSALRIGEAGSGKVTYADAAWAGSLSHPDTGVGAVDVQRYARTLVLGQSDATGIVTVRGVDARTGIVGPALGTIEGAVAGQVSLGSIGRHALVNVLRTDPFGSEDFDVYFVDIPTAGSLRAVAATPGLDDVAP